MNHLRAYTIYLALMIYRDGQTRFLYVYPQPILRPVSRPGVLLVRDVNVPAGDIGNDLLYNSYEWFRSFSVVAQNQNDVYLRLAR